MISTWYFALSARWWADRGDDLAHLEPFRLGLLGMPAPRRAVDLGTGVGGSAALLAERFPDASVVAIDASRRMLRLARERHRAPNLRFVRARVERLPFADNEFDLVTMHNAYPDFAELERISTRNAHVLVSNTYVALDSEPGRWATRWHQHGFKVVDGESVGDGYWQHFVRFR